MVQWILPRTAFRILSVTLLGGALFMNADYRALAQEGGQSLAEKLDLSLYGYVEASYTQNFNNPKDGVNQHRSFDGDANSFRPNMTQIVLEKAAKAGGTMKDRAGFRVKLNVGEDAKFTGGNSGSDEFDFQETYIQYIAPIGNGLTFQAGRMNTLIGYEVIESPLNPNFSRSFLFGMGEPFTVTGLRASYDFNDKVSFAISAINSFTGATADDNNSKSVEALLSYAPMDNVGVSLFAFWGPEGVRNDSVPNPVKDKDPMQVENTDRVQVGGILDWQATDKLEFVVEGYYGNQANAVLDPGTEASYDSCMHGANKLTCSNKVAATEPMIGNAQWGGIAGYVIYDFTDALGIRVRTEYFSDGSGFFTCGGEGGDSSSGNALQCAEEWTDAYNDPDPNYTGAQNLWETTWTLQYKPVEDLITRLEYRYDKSNRRSFWDGAGYGNNQSTLAVEAIFLF